MTIYSVCYESQTENRIIEVDAIRISKLKDYVDFRVDRIIKDQEISKGKKTP